MKFRLMTLAALFTVLSSFIAGTVLGNGSDELIALTDQIQNSSPSISFDFGTDQNKTSFKISEDLLFYFTPAQDCYLIVINIGSSGVISVLFPNKFHPESKVEAGKGITIPPASAGFALKAIGPPGKERIKAIVCTDPILTDVTTLQEELNAVGKFRGSVFLTLKDPKSVIMDLRAKLSSLDKNKWAVYDTVIDVFGNE